MITLFFTEDVKGYFAAGNDFRTVTDLLDALDVKKNLFLDDNKHLKQLQHADQYLKNFQNICNNIAYSLCKKCRDLCDSSPNTIVTIDKDVFKILNYIDDFFSIPVNGSHISCLFLEGGSKMPFLSFALICGQKVSFVFLNGEDSMSYIDGQYIIRSIEDINCMIQKVGTNYVVFSHNKLCDDKYAGLRSRVRNFIYNSLSPVGKCREFFQLVPHVFSSFRKT